MVIGEQGYGMVCKADFMSAARPNWELLEVHEGDVLPGSLQFST